MIMLLSAVLPAMILFYYIYRRDTVKEPTPQLLKGFGLGALAGIISGLLETLMAVIGLVDYEPQGFFSAVYTAFAGAALPEELVKLGMLWLLVRHNKWFDEWMDGVVYAVSIGMGFAAIENVGYVFSSEGEWLNVAIMRGITAVPAHFSFAVLMGFFFSLVHIGRRHTQRDKVMVLAAPVLAHGVYDGLLMAGDTLPDSSASAFFSLMFIGLLIWLVRVCRRYIRTLRAFDTMPRYSN